MFNEHFIKTFENTWQMIETHALLSSENETIQDFLFYRPHTVYAGPNLNDDDLLLIDKIVATSLHTQLQAIKTQTSRVGGIFRVGQVTPTQLLFFANPVSSMNSPF